MKTGIEYAHSDEKREFDRRAVQLIKPFAWAAMKMLETHSGDDTVFLQTRIGENGEPFKAYKLRTLYSDGMTPLPGKAAFMRRSGMDELIQYKNVEQGEMSVVARRPLTPGEYDEAFDGMPPSLVQDYLDIVVPTRPGLISSFVIATHLGQIEDASMRYERLRLDVHDVEYGSRARDRELFKTAISYGLTNRMRRGDIRPREAA